MGEGALSLAIFECLLLMMGRASYVSMTSSQCRLLRGGRVWVDVN